MSALQLLRPGCLLFVRRLVLPKEHKISFLELGADETAAVWELMKAGENILKKLGYKTFSVLVREGASESKSVEHLHYHIIPNERIGDLDHDGNAREVMTEKEAESVAGEIKKQLTS